MSRSQVDVVIALSLITLAVVLRLLPHPANFAPVAAVAIFGGAVLPRRYAVMTPLAAMVVSDWFIGFHRLIPVTWGCYALIALASSVWLKKKTILRGVVLTLSGSVFFFVVTNVAVWIWGGLYSHTASGLVVCFTLAIPFFRNTLASDIFYTASLFGLYALATRISYRTFKLTGTMEQ